MLHLYNNKNLTGSDVRKEDISTIPYSPRPLFFLSHSLHRFLKCFLFCFGAFQFHRVSRFYVVDFHSQKPDNVFHLHCISFQLHSPVFSISYYISKINSYSCFVNIFNVIYFTPSYKHTCFLIIVDDSKAEKTQKSAYKTINFAEIFRVQIATTTDLLEEKKLRLEANIPTRLYCEVEQSQIAGEVQRLSDTPRQGGKSQSETDRLSSGAGTGGSRN